MLREAGRTAADLKAADFTFRNLKAAGYPAIELRAAGATIFDLWENQADIVPLRAAGFGPAELAKVVSVSLLVVHVSPDRNRTLAPLARPEPKASVRWSCGGSQGYSKSELQALGIPGVQHVRDRHGHLPEAQRKQLEMMESQRFQDQLRTELAHQQEEMDRYRPS